MRTPTLGSISYSPNQVPDDPAALPMFLREELAYIAAQIRLLALGHIDATYVEPDKPRPGDIRRAVGGIYWDPGGGEGVYFYNEGGVWTQLG